MRAQVVAKLAVLSAVSIAVLLGIRGLATPGQMNANMVLVIATAVLATGFLISLLIACGGYAVSCGILGAYLTYPRAAAGAGYALPFFALCVLACILGAVGMFVMADD